MRFILSLSTGEPEKINLTSQGTPVCCLTRNCFCRSPDTVHEVQVISLSIPRKAKIVEIAAHNATGGVYGLQSSYYKRNQLQLETTETIRWDADPGEALSKLQSTGATSCTLVTLTKPSCKTCFCRSQQARYKNPLIFVLKTKRCFPV